MKKILIMATIFCSWATFAVDVVELRTKKGIKVWFVEDVATQSISVQAFFKDAGSIQDPDQKLGLSVLAANSMNQGTTALDYKAFERKKEELSIQNLDISANTDHIHVALHTLVRSKGESFELLRDTLMNPRFDQLQVQTLREQMMSALQAQERDPSSVASLEMKKTIFGDHPYAKRHQGTQASLRAITKEDLLNFSKSRFSTDRLLVGVCGHLSKDEVISLVDRVFGDLPQKSTLSHIKNANIKLNGQVKKIHWDVPQASVRFVAHSLSPQDPDFEASIILFALLGGGGFESRLMQEVRVKRGLTYGIGITQLHQEKADVFWGGFSANTQKVDEAVRVIQDIWKELKKTGPTEEEVEKTKDFLINSYVLRFTETSQIAGYLLSLQLLGFPYDYIKKRNALIRNVKLEDVKRVAEKLLNPDQVTFVIVGQTEKRKID